MSVVKVGGSVLRDREGYARVAHRLAGRRGSWCAVVSAAHGVTDRLVARDGADALWAHHADMAARALPGSLRDDLDAAHSEAADGRGARLLAWGEQASIAVLQTHLHAFGVRARLAELGGRLPRRGRILVPGFYLRCHGKLIVLSRGSSDVSAVDAAVARGQHEVEFWKEGGGVRAGDTVMARTDHASLLQHLGDTIRPLHPEAVRRAAALGIRLRIEDPWGSGQATVVC